MRYINKQQHNFSCGHVAVGNALKWLGYNISYDDALEFVESVKPGNHRGSWSYELARALDVANVRYLIKFEPTTDYLKSQIDKGNSIIMLYRHRTGAHWVFIDGYNKRGFRAWNWRSRKSKRKSPYMAYSFMKFYIHYSSVNWPALYRVCFIVSPFPN